jgi:hypothetical protein
MQSVDHDHQTSCSREDFFLRNIEGRNDLKDDETRKLLFFERYDDNEVDNEETRSTDRLLPSARSKLWFKWSGADLIQCNFPAGYAMSMLNDEPGAFIREDMRTILDATEHEIDKDLSRTFSDSELRERFQVQSRTQDKNLSFP